MVQSHCIAVLTTGCKLVGGWLEVGLSKRNQYCWLPYRCLDQPRTGPSPGSQRGLRGGEHLDSAVQQHNTVLLSRDGDLGQPVLHLTQHRVQAGLD